MVLCLCMIFPSAVTFVSAAEELPEETPAYTGGICEHHLEHTEDCGYVEAVEGQPCQHEHTEECFEWVTECVHEHTEDCYEESSVSGNTATPSDSKERKLVCNHECSEESGCITQKNVCQHEHDSECGYSEGS